MNLNLPRKRISTSCSIPLNPDGLFCPRISTTRRPIPSWTQFRTTCHFLSWPAWPYQRELSQDLYVSRMHSAPGVFSGLGSGAVVSYLEPLQGVNYFS